MPERLFCMIVRWWHTGPPEESKEKSLLRACEIGSEGLGGFERKCLLADAIEFPDKVFFDLGRRLPGDIAGFKFFPRVAELRA